MSKWKTELISVCHDIIQLKNDLNYYGNELKLTQDSFLLQYSLYREVIVTLINLNFW